MNITFILKAVRVFNRTELTQKPVTKAKPTRCMNELLMYNSGARKIQDSRVKSECVCL